MLDRRTAIAALVSMTAMPLATSAQRGSRSQEDVLRTLIEEVIEQGKTSMLPELVAQEATLPDFDVSGVDTLAAISLANHVERQGDYTEYSFPIEAIATTGDWALAYVRFVAETTTGEAVDTPGFYAARFNADGLIDQLFIGQ
jgi:hypothetical protein